MESPEGWERAACILCGAGDVPVLTRSRDPLHCRRDDSVFRLVRCGTCDLAYVDPRPVRDRMGDFYPSTYGAHRDVEGSEGRILKRKSKRFDPVASLKPGRYLDVGCGSGSSLLRMKSKGWDAVGFEVSGQAADAGRAAGLDIRTGRELSEAGLEPGTFDLVTFFCVLPHLHDPVAALREASRLMKPGGVLYLTLPNLRSVNFMLFRDGWYHLDLPRHLYFFSEGSLRTLAERTGFAPGGRRFRSAGGGFKNSLRLAAESGAAGGLFYETAKLRPARWLIRFFFRWVVDPLRMGDTVDYWWTKRAASAGAPS